MQGILYSLFFLIIATAHPISLIALPDKMERTDAPSGHAAPPLATPPSNDDHGFVFPLEDVMPTPKKGNDRFYIEFFNMLATLGLVIAIILIAAWLLRRILNTRMEQINTSSIIKIIEKRAISPKSAIYLLEIQDKTFAIAESQNGITHLGEINIPSEPESTEKTSFRKILDKTE